MNLDYFASALFPIYSENWRYMLYSKEIRHMFFYTIVKLGFN